MNEGIRVRVVSMPSWELFEKQSKAYKESVLPPSIHTRLAVEAGVTLGWYKYVTAQGDVIGIDRFGESGPGDEVMNLFGFTTENVYQRAKALLKKKEMMKAVTAADDVIVA
jgi:transketolase